MDKLTTAAVAVRTAESRLRELMQSAVASGEYRDLPLLVRVAEQLSEAATKLEHPAASLNIQPESSATRANAKPLRSANRVAASRKPRRRLSSPNGAYPKFCRADDKLVKIGWSKTDRAEYRHRVPRFVVRLALIAVNKMDHCKGPFAVDQIMPITDPNDGTEVATHQVYIALAWFKTEGIVMQHGRGGYTVLVKADPDKLLEERWHSLPKAT